MNLNSIYIKRASNQLKNEEEAIQDIASKIIQDKIAGIIFFCSSNYDLTKITNAINHHFKVPIIGCTTAGEIGNKYQKNGISALSFSEEVFAFHTTYFEYDEINSQNSASQIEVLEENLLFNHQLNKENMFAFLLNDGMAMQEEKTTAFIHNALKGVNLVGGSAGDDYKFASSPVFINGEFHNGRAVMALIESKIDFKIYKIQHIEPSDTDVVITEADTLKRLVKEINGAPAAQELAEIMNISREELVNNYFYTKPLMLQIGSEWYVRSIQQIFDDDSISFACAIDEGLVLNIGKVSSLVSSLKESLTIIDNDFKTIECTLGCECMDRLMEIESLSAVHSVEKELAKINFIGFHTYGEQFNAIHVNQTLTCVVMGEKNNV